MGRLDGVDAAGRQIAGLLGYNPGPGIYSRLERAIEAMPANVRVQELPGLLKRYKEGVPGWELKATDLDSTIAGRDVVPRDELLAAVRERSPVHTHREIVLGGSPQTSAVLVRNFDGGLSPVPEVLRQALPARLGHGISHGNPKYAEYGQGGEQYTELLLGQPIAPGEYGSHWGGGMMRSGPEARNYARNNIVAHARFDTHGDALRINELQSDLGIHNRKAREAGPMPDYAGGDGPFDFMPPQDEAGMAAMAQKRKAIPFPLEDAWADLLIKRIALEAARKGHRAIEVASPRAIADKVGGNIDNYEHFYGKVVPGAIERLGRKMGGLTPDNVGVAPEFRPNAIADMPQYDTHQQLRDQFKAATGDDQPGPNFWRLYSGMRYDSLSPAEQALTYDRFGGSHPVSQVDGGLPQEMYDYLHSLGLSPEAAQGITSSAMHLAPQNARAMYNFAVQEQLPSIGNLTKKHAGEVGRRYIMSDEMRRRLIEQGVGASLLAPLLMQGEE